MHLKVQTKLSPVCSVQQMDLMCNEYKAETNSVELRF